MSQQDARPETAPPDPQSIDDLLEAAAAVHIALAIATGHAEA